MGILILKGRGFDLVNQIGSVVWGSGIFVYHLDSENLLHLILFEFICTLGENFSLLFSVNRCS